MYAKKTTENHAKAIINGRTQNAIIDPENLIHELKLTGLKELAGNVKALSDCGFSCYASDRAAKEGLRGMSGGQIGLQCASSVGYQFVNKNCGVSIQVSETTHNTASEFSGGDNITVTSKTKVSVSIYTKHIKNDHLRLQAKWIKKKVAERINANNFFTISQAMNIAYLMGRISMNLLADKPARDRAVGDKLKKLREEGLDDLYKPYEELKKLEYSEKKPAKFEEVPFERSPPPTSYQMKEPQPFTTQYTPMPVPPPQGMYNFGYPDNVTIDPPEQHTFPQFPPNQTTTFNPFYQTQQSPPQNPFSSYTQPGTMGGAPNRPNQPLPQAWEAKNPQPNAVGNAPRERPYPQQPGSVGRTPNYTGPVQPLPQFRPRTPKTVERTVLPGMGNWKTQQNN